MTIDHEHPCELHCRLSSGTILRLLSRVVLSAFKIHEHSICAVFRGESIRPKFPTFGLFKRFEYCRLKVNSPTPLWSSNHDTNLPLFFPRHQRIYFFIGQLNTVCCLRAVVVSRLKLLVYPRTKYNLFVFTWF